MTAASAGTSILAFESEASNCEGNAHFRYFDPRSQTHAAPDAYRRLTQFAQRQLWIWDPYVWPKDVDSFGDLKGVTVRVLSLLSTGSDPQIERAREFVQAFENRFRANGVVLELRALCLDHCNEQSARECWPFHDRYLFVDDEVFLAGASLTYFRVRKAPVYLNRVSDLDSRELITRKFIAAWNDHTATFVWDEEDGFRKVEKV